MSGAANFRWTSAALSHPGLVRELNEDAYLDHPQRGVWAVADGMGGHTLGDVASRQVIAALEELRPPDRLEQFVATAEDRLQAANRQLRAEAAMRQVPIIGSTAVVLLARDGDCGYVWAGDSRLYLCRAGSLRQLTRDHSRAEELKSLGDPALSEAMAQRAQRTITRAIGARDTLELDAATLTVHDGDIFLLCSDGLSNEVSEAELRATLLSSDCRQAAQALITKALDRGGRDNISAVVVRADDFASNDRTIVNPAL